MARDNYDNAVEATADRDQQRLLLTALNALGPGPAAKTSATPGASSASTARSTPGAMTAPQSLPLAVQAHIKRALGQRPRTADVCPVGAAFHALKFARCHAPLVLRLALRGVVTAPFASSLEA
jgi:hypothetical protein